MYYKFPILKKNLQWEMCFITLNICKILKIYSVHYATKFCSFPTLVHSEKIILNVHKYIQNCLDNYGA